MNVQPIRPQQARPVQAKAAPANNDEEQLRIALAMSRTEVQDQEGDALIRAMQASMEAVQNEEVKEMERVMIESR